MLTLLHHRHHPLRTSTAAALAAAAPPLAGLAPPPPLAHTVGRQTWRDTCQDTRPAQRRRAKEEEGGGHLATPPLFSALEAVGWHTRCRHSPGKASVEGRRSVAHIRSKNNETCGWVACRREGLFSFVLTFVLWLDSPYDRAQCPVDDAAATAAILVVAIAIRPRERAEPGLFLCEW